MTKLELRDAIEAMDAPIGACDEYLMAFEFDAQARPSPDVPEGIQHIAVFAVRGGSEGYYFHVEAILNGGTTELLVLGKGWALPPLLLLTSAVTLAIHGDRPTLDPTART